MGRMRDFKKQQYEHKHVYIAPEEPVLDPKAEEAVYQWLVENMEYHIRRWLEPGPGNMWGFRIPMSIMPVKEEIIFLPNEYMVSQFIVPAAVENLEKKGIIKEYKEPIYGYKPSRPRRAFELVVSPDIPEPDKSILLVLQHKQRTLRGLQRELEKRFNLKIHTTDLLDKLEDLMKKQGKVVHQRNKQKSEYWFAY